MFRYADPVLKHYQLHAVAFIITGFVGTHQPYDMTGQELKLLQASGRWDLEAHTYLGHTRVPSDGAGNTEPFLATQMWLPQQHRVETLDEYRTRVRRDLERCVADLVAHGFQFPGQLGRPAHGVERGPASRVPARGRAPPRRPAAGRRGDGELDDAGPSIH